MKLVLSLLTLLLIGRGSGDKIQSARYVLIKSSSSSQIHLEACASNGSIETCGTWCYSHLHRNCSRHFFISSVNKETGVKVASNKQDESFFQTWNRYKCNCHSERNPNTSGRHLFTSIVVGLESVLILLVIVMTIGWIWTCKIAIKRGKLIKMKENPIPLSANKAYSVHSIPAEDQIPEVTYYATTSLIKS